MKQEWKGRGTSGKLLKGKEGRNKKNGNKSEKNIMEKVGVNAKIEGRAYMEEIDGREWVREELKSG